MIKAGITGGIGSGKSLAGKIFSSFGVPVYNADEAGKKLLMSDKSIHEKIRKRFGDVVFTNGFPDRKKLAGIVFKDKKALADLNGIIHPAVKNDFERWVGKNESAPYILKEAAILIESGTYKDVDVIITVTAPEELRIERIMKRDGVARGQVLERMHNQLSDEEKIKLSDYVIINDGKAPVLPQVLKIHEQMIIDQ